MARYSLDPERSHLTAEARSTLHPIRADTDGIEGFVDAAIGPDGLDLGAPVASTVELAIAHLRTGVALVDREIERRLDLGRHPRVRGEVRAVERIGPGAYRVRGDLTFHGVTRTVEGTATVRVVDDRTLAIEGALVFDMRAFGLEPPRLLLLRVQPDVRVTGRAVAVRDGGAHPPS